MKRKNKDGILKSIFDFVLSLFGIDREKAKNNAELQSVGDSFNDVSSSFCGGVIFQTKKEKEKAERVAQEQMQRDMAETNKNIQEITKTLKDISKNLGGK